MRIMHVITRLIVGGAQENTILSCEGLQAGGHQVHLLAGPTTGPEGSLVGQIPDQPLNVGLAQERRHLADNDSTGAKRLKDKSEFGQLAGARR